MLGTNPPPPAQSRRHLTLLALVLLLAVVTRLYFVATNALSYDESHILTFGALVADGFAPYREVFVGIPPLAVLTVAASEWLLGDGGWVRLPLMLTGVVGIGLLAVLAARHAPRLPWLAAALAALFFSFNPHYFDISNTLNLEAAALAWGVAALWALERARTGSGWGWAAASGVAFALSLLYKVLLPFLPGVLLVQMILAARAAAPTLTGQVGWLLRVGLLWLAGALAVLGLAALLFGPLRLYDQVVDFRLDLRTATVAGDEEVNVAEELEAFDLLQLIPLAVGGLLGVAVLARARAASLWLWGAWLLLSLLFLTTHIPLRPRHLVILVPPLAGLTGMGLAALWDGLRRPAARTALAAGVAGVAALTLVWSWRVAPIPPFVANDPPRAEVIELIEQSTAPDDCLVSKENRYYFLTDRFPTPYLSEVSTSRLFSGKLTDAGVVDGIDAADCALLVYANSYDELAPNLEARAAAYYALRLAVGGSAEDEPITVFAVPMHTQVAPEMPLAVNLGGEIMLAGYDLTPGPWTTGQEIYLSTYWQTLRPPATDYRLFVHWVDASGQLAHAADHFPFELPPGVDIDNVELNPAYLTAKPLPANYPNAGMIPTQLWQPGKTLKETIAVPLTLPPGDYTLAIGLFDPVTGARLDVDDAAPGGIENQIVLTTVTVLPGEAP